VIATDATSAVGAFGETMYDPGEGVVVVAIAERIADGEQRALRILRGDHRLADGMNEVGIPLRTEPGAAGPNVLSEPRVVLQVFGDRDPATEVLRDLAVEPREQAPAFGQVLVAGSVDGAYVDGAVEAEAVDVVFFEPHENVVAEVLPDLTVSVSRPGVPPRRMRPVVVVEVDAAALVLGPAVELPQIEVARAQVVVHDVEDHRDALLVGALDESLERHRASLGDLNRKDMGRVVPPRPLSRELRVTGRASQRASGFFST